MRSDIRIIEIPDEFGGERYQLAKMFYDDEGYLTNVQPIHDFDTYQGLVNFTDQVYKASLMSSVLKDGEGKYVL